MIRQAGGAATDAAHVLLVGGAVALLGGVLIGVVQWVVELVSNDWLHYGLSSLAAGRLAPLCIQWITRLAIAWAILVALRWAIAYRAGDRERGDFVFGRLLALAAGFGLVLYLGFQSNRYTFKEYWSFDDARHLAGIALPPALFMPQVLAVNAGILSAGIAILVLVRWLAPRVLQQRQPTRMARGLLLAADASALVFVIALSAWTASARPAQSPPNVLLISVDTLRADHLGVYGYDRPTSPHIDELARGGVTFERAIAVTNWTLPSHMSMMTGQLPSAHGVHTVQHRLAGSKVTLAEVLKNAGYQTAAFTGGYNVDARFGFDQGFDLYHGDTLAQLSMEEKRRYGKGIRLSYLLPSLDAWLTEHQSDPFFVFLHFWDVHAPYMPHAEHVERWSPGYAGRIDVLTHELVDEFNRPGMPANGDDVDRVRALYDNEISFVDHHLGQLWAVLRKLGLMDNTIIVLTSDHGDELMEHAFGHGQALYDPEVHVPLIVRYPPKISAGQRVQQVVSSVDILPTILDLAAVPYGDAIASEIQGRSLVGSWERSLPGLAAVMEVANGRRTALRSDHYKYVRERAKDGRITKEELYDLRADPAEKQNIFASHGELAQRLGDELDDRLRAAANTRSGGKAEQAQLSEEFTERLRALGYDP